MGDRSDCAEARAVEGVLDISAARAPLLHLLLGGLECIAPPSWQLDVVHRLYTDLLEEWVPLLERIAQRSRGSLEGCLLGGLEVGQLEDFGRVQPGSLLCSGILTGRSTAYKLLTAHDECRRQNHPPTTPEEGHGATESSALVRLDQLRHTERVRGAIHLIGQPLAASRSLRLIQHLLEARADRAGGGPFFEDLRRNRGCRVGVEVLPGDRNGTTAFWAGLFEELDAQLLRETSAEGCACIAQPRRAMLEELGGAAGLPHVLGHLPRATRRGADTRVPDRRENARVRVGVGHSPLEVLVRHIDLPRECSLLLVCPAQVAHEHCDGVEELGRQDGYVGGFGLRDRVVKAGLKL